MQFLKNIQNMMQAQENLEDALYAAVLDEVNAGMVMKDLWAKSMAHGDFDHDKTRAFYIRERVARLKKKSKAINEYFRLVADEDDFEGISSAEKRRYDEAIDLHNREVQKLEVKRQNLADEITVEASRLGRRKSEVAVDMSRDTAKSPKQVKEDKIYIFSGVILAALTFLVIYFDLNTMFGFFSGLAATLAFASGLINSDDSTVRIERAHRMLDADSPLKTMREQYQRLIDQASELRDQKPRYKQLSGEFNSDRKQVLENELQPLFSLHKLETGSY